MRRRTVYILSLLLCSGIILAGCRKDLCYDHDIHGLKVRTVLYPQWELEWEYEHGIDWDTQWDSEQFLHEYEEFTPDDFVPRLGIAGDIDLPHVNPFSGIDENGKSDFLFFPIDIRLRIDIGERIPEIAQIFRNGAVYDGGSAGADIFGDRNLQRLRQGVDKHLSAVRLHFRMGRKEKERENDPEDKNGFRSHFSASFTADSKTSRICPAYARSNHSKVVFPYPVPRTMTAKRRGYLELTYT